MQAVRLARHRVRLFKSIRCLATTTTAPSAVGTSVSASPSLIPLSNVEAQWEKMSKEDQLLVHQQLEELQKKDWKTLSIDEKKAGEFFLVILFPLAYIS